MLEFDVTGVSKVIVIDVNKTIGSNQCIICHYWYLLGINCRFQPKVCNGSHELMQKALRFNYVALVSAKGCNTHFQYMNKGEDKDLSKNADF